MLRRFLCLSSQLNQGHCTFLSILAPEIVIAELPSITDSDMGHLNNFAN